MHKKKILLIKLWAIGEVALSTPCIGRLKTGLPEIDLYFLVGDKAKDIIIGNPDIKKVFSVNEGVFLKPDLIKLALLIMELKRERFDAIITFHYASFFSLFAFLLGAPKRFGLKRPGSWSFNTADITSDGVTNPRVFDYLKILELLSVQSVEKETKVVIYPNDEEKSHVEFLMKENNLRPKKFIILSPTGGENPAASKFNLNIKNKVWPLEHYKKLCGLILENSNFDIAIIGQETERPRADYIKMGFDGRVKDLVGKTNLRELKILAEESAICITNDSGPMFLLCSSTSLVISIFGPTDPYLICSHLRNTIVIKDEMNCSPCSYDSTVPDRVRDCEKAICMERVTPEIVFKKISELLKMDNENSSKDLWLHC